MRRLIGVLLAVAVLFAAPGFGGPESAPAEKLVELTKTVAAVTKTATKVLPPPTGASPDVVGGAEIKISYPELRSLAGPNPAVEAINATIMKSVLARDGDQPPAASVEQVIDEFLAEFEKSRKETPDMPGGWYRNFEVAIRHADDELLSLEMTDGAFLGGAHPNTNVIYQVFSLKTGAPVDLGTLIPAAQVPALTRIAEIQFRKARDLKPEESLPEAGFTFEKDTFTLNSNYLVSPEGLAFFYNSYEVAPYAMGQTKVVIPWSSLKDIVDPKSPAGHFLTP